jgi:hypothetical protein
MSKITIPLKKYSKSSIDLVEKGFDPNLRGEWIGDPEISQLFINKYISEKYNSELHTVPFIDFSIFYDNETNETLVKLTEYNTLNRYYFKKDSFEPFFKKYRNPDKRFTFYPINTAELNKTQDDIDYHAISALYDKKTNKVEIFDSIGSDFTYYKQTFKDLFTEIYGSEIKIVYIVNRCVKFGKLEGERCIDFIYNYKAEGFCVIWVLWFLELRLSNPSISKEKLIEKALEKLKNGTKVCELLRGYAQFVDKIFSKYSLERTSTNLIIKSRNIGKKTVFTRKDYSYLYIILTAIFGSTLAISFLKKFRKN